MLTHDKQPKTLFPISAKTVARLLQRYSNVIAMENMRGRFNLALGVGSAGFSEGMVCALPVATPQTAPGNAVTS